MKIHVVQKGDTLWTIAKNYQVSFEELKAANAYLADPDMIMPGMKIKIPAAKAAADKAAGKKADYMHPYANNKPVYQTLPEEIPDIPVMPYAGFMMQAVPKMPEMPNMKEIPKVPKMEQMPKAEEIKEWTKMPEKPPCTCKEKSAVKPIHMMPHQMPQMMPQQMPHMMPQQMPHMMPPCGMPMPEHHMMMEPNCHPMPYHCCCPCHHPYRGPF